MISMFWNCRGLGSATLVRALFGLIRKYRPSIIFLSETKMKGYRLDGLRRRMKYVRSFNVERVGLAGGLSLWWNEFVEVDTVDASSSFIDARCRDVERQLSFRFTGVYGTLYWAAKSKFWKGMQRDFSPSSLPWICGGDFNDYIWDWEKVGGAEVSPHRSRYLGEFMNCMELLEVESCGPKYTWWGTRNGSLVEVRLDRGLVNR